MDADAVGVRRYARCALEEPEMWIPTTSAEVERVVQGGLLAEGPTFDAKQQLPDKSIELAKDMAAMANDGGVLIYGIGEDEAGRPTVLTPLLLANQTERITNIAQTAIMPALKINISALPLETDPTKGYVVVSIPASERAPHMVVVKHEHRYYGRNGTTIGHLK